MHVIEVHRVFKKKCRTLQSKSKQMNFAYQEVKGVKEVKELRRMSCCLKDYAKKTVVLTPQRP